MYKAYICSWDRDRRFVGAYTIFKDNKLVTEKVKMQLPYCTCNEAEYLTLHQLLYKLKELGIQNCQIYSKVELVARQVNGQWRVKTPSLVNYVNESKRLIQEVQGQISWMPFEELRKWVNGAQITWHVGK